MAAATNLEVTLELSITGTLTSAPSGTVTGDTSRLATGSNGFDAISEAYTFGTGDNNAKEWYTAERTLATNTADSLDLAGSTLLNPFGTAIVATKVKELYLEIDAPDGTKALKLGPNNAATALVLPFDAATSYMTVFDKVWISNPFGYAVGAGATDILTITNNTAVSVTYRLLVIVTV